MFPLLSLFSQVGPRNDFIELRGYLGRNYRGVLQALDAKNQILLRNTERLAPAQAAEMRERMKAPDRLPDPPILTARIDNVGQGLLSFLFEDDFIVEEVRFVFCPAQGTGDLARPERLLTLQVLLDEREALRPTPVLLQSIYQLPPPLVPAAYQAVLMYPLAANIPWNVWDFGTAEALYQAVPGQALVTGQLWITDKTVAADCAAIPRLR